MTSTTRTATTPDGTALLVRDWDAGDEPWAHVLIVHGLGEHSGRYEHVGGWFADAGIDATSFDLRGFGASGGRRAWVEEWSHHHDDVEELLASVRAAAGDRPVILFGHSLGGLIAFGYAVADPPRPLPDRLILSAPAVGDALPAWQRSAAKVLNRVKPTLALKNAFDGSVLSRDPLVAEAYLADELNHHASTVRLGALGFAEQERALAALHRLTIPTLVYHGEDDRLVPTPVSEPFAALPNVTRRTYPGLRHESHNEPEGPQVIDDAVAWVRGTLGAAAARTTAGSVG